MTEQRYGGPEGKCGICQQFKNACRCADKLDIAAIRARAEAATPGPWEHYEHPERESDDPHDRSDDVRLPGGTSWRHNPIAVETRHHDAAFIASARTDVPALCDALEAAELEIRTLRTIHACLPSGLEHEVNVQRDRAEAAEARVKELEARCQHSIDSANFAATNAIRELEARLATARDAAFEEGAQFIEVKCGHGKWANGLRKLKGAKR